MDEQRTSGDQVSPEDVLGRMPDKMRVSVLKRTVAVGISAIVILAATLASAAAATKPAAPKDTSPIELRTGGLAASVGAPNMSTSAISSMPMYCCPGYSPGGAQGLTTYGQGSVKGQGTAARDAAIAKAIADATEQAKAAAAAAGISLGKIIDLQVSSSYFGYADATGISTGVSSGATATKGGPIPPAVPTNPAGVETGVATGVAAVGSASTGSGTSGSGTTGSGGAFSGGSTGASPPCPAGAPCVQPMPTPVETYASVTITWSIN